MHPIVRAGIVTAFAMVMACDSQSQTQPPTATATPAPAAAPAGDPAGQPAAGQPAEGQPAEGQPAEGQPAAGQPSNTQRAPATREEAHVSSSAGVEGSIIVFWPRIIPKEIVDENRDLAAALQKHVRAVVERHFPNRSIDFRPEPERVCPKAGCTSVSIGTLISRRKHGCLVLALVQRPGVSPLKIIPWAGKVELKSDTVGFREYPENQVTVADYVPCDSLLKTLDAEEPKVVDALKAATPPLPAAGQ